MENKMKALATVSIFLILALVLFVSTGCVETTASVEASNLDSELEDLENLYEAMENLELEEMELNELEGLL